MLYANFITNLDKVLTANYNTTEYVCPHPPYLPNGQLVSTGDSIVLECMQGHRFYDGKKKHELPCTSAIDKVGRPPHVCVGKEISYYYWDKFLCSCIFVYIYYRWP